MLKIIADNLFASIIVAGIILAGVFWLIRGNKKQKRRRIQEKLGLADAKARKQNEPNLSFIEILPCKMGFHKWSDWDADRNSQSTSIYCELKRKCYNCSIKETKQESHIWKEWVFVGDGSENQQQSCSRCWASQKRQPPVQEINSAIQQAIMSESKAWNRMFQIFTTLPVVTMDETKQFNTIDGLEKAIFFFVWCRVEKYVFKAMSDMYPRLEDSPVKHLRLSYQTGDGGDPWLSTRTYTILIAHLGNNKYITLDYSNKHNQSQVPWGTEI